MGKYLAVVTLVDKEDEYTSDATDMATILEGLIGHEFNPEVTVYELKKFAGEDEQRVKVTFHPQAWQNDYAISVDPEGETEFTVSLSDATDEEGNLLPDGSYEANALKNCPNAPKWIQKWKGPFYITLDRLPTE